MDPNVTSVSGQKLFNFAAPFEWNKLLFEIKLIPHEFDYSIKMEFLFNPRFLKYF